MPVDNETLLLSTQGSIYADDALGNISIAGGANSTGQELLFDVNIERSNFSRTAVGTGFLADLGLGLLKGIVVTGAEKAFGYGLDKLLFDKLGINIVTLKTIQTAVEELGRKIDALSVQLTEIEGRLPYLHTLTTFRATKSRQDFRPIGIVCCSSYLTLLLRSLLFRSCKDLSSIFSFLSESIVL